MLWIRWISAFFLLSGSAHLQAQEKAGQHYQETFDTFGTLVTVSIFGQPQAKAQAEVAEVIKDMRRMNDSWHPYQAGPLARINTLLPTGGRFYYPPSNLPLFQESYPLVIASQGLFNPAVGGFIQLWGFDKEASLPRQPPPAEAIAKLLAQKPDLNDVVIDGLQMFSTNPAVQLDFGAFAKGYAVDRSIERLREFGVKNAIITAGGDMRAIGRHGDRPWIIGIRHPRANGIVASVEIEGDESVSTSGDYERYFMYNGVRYHHIFDPRTGYPARGSMSVTLITDRSAKADAASTALFVAGPEMWRDVAKSMGIDQVMLWSEDEKIYLSEKMAKRLKFVMPVDQYQIIRGGP